MRFVCLLLLVGCSVVGCRGPKPDPAPAGSVGTAFTPSDPQVIVTPSVVLAGTVARVNPQGTFAIMSFPIGSLPAINQHLGVFRNGLKVGEVKITGPQREYNIAGDVVAGQAKIGDVVREN